MLTPFICKHNTILLYCVRIRSTGSTKIGTNYQCLAILNRAYDPTENDKGNETNLTPTGFEPGKRIIIVYVRIQYFFLLLF